MCERGSSRMNSGSNVSSKPSRRVSPDLNHYEATLAAEQKDLEETHTVVLARELAADVRDAGLNSRGEELADREKRLAEREQQLAGRQLEELVTACSRLEGLQVARAGEAQKV
jgi:hypothetical protein